MKTVIILRSISGAGKSTFAEFIASLDKGAVICCADDYHMQDGVYVFNPKKLGLAHKLCFDKFKKALYNAAVNTIIIANINTTDREVSTYKDVADAANVRSFVVVLENRHGGTNVHDVPSDVLENQKTRLAGSIKL